MLPYKITVHAINADLSSLQEAQIRKLQTSHTVEYPLKVYTLKVLRMKPAIFCAIVDCVLLGNGIFLNKPEKQCPLRDTVEPIKDKRFQLQDNKFSGCQT